jgi:hypothetical protein
MVCCLVGLFAYLLAWLITFVLYRFEEKFCTKCPGGFLLKPSGWGDFDEVEPVAHLFGFKKLGKLILLKSFV